MSKIDQKITIILTKGEKGMANADKEGLGFDRQSPSCLLKRRLQTGAESEGTGQDRGEA